MRRLTACVLLFTVGAIAAAKPVETAWTGLGGLILSRKVALVLPDGAAVEGEAVAVQPDALELTITKTSDPRGYPKGAASIPRSSISTLQLMEMRVVGRVIGTTVGLFAGVVTGTVILLSNGLFAKTSTGQNVGAVTVVIGFPVAGFFAGRALDRRVTIIKVAP
jgi:hypothetical protein